MSTTTTTVTPVMPPIPTKSSVVNPVSKIEAFFASTMNKTGLLSLGATVLFDAVTAYTAHTFSWPVTITGVAVGLSAIFAPDNTKAKTDEAALVKDGFTAWASKQPADIVKVFNDATVVAGDFVSPVASVVTSTTK